MGEDKKYVGKTKELEFGGVLGALVMTVGLPLTVFALNIICNKVSVFCLSICLLYSLLIHAITYTYYGWHVFFLASLSQLPQILDCYHIWVET